MAVLGYVPDYQGNPVYARLYAWRERLLEARFSGIRSVRDSNGEEITYRSGAELAAALAALDSEIQRLAHQRPSTFLFNTSKGL